MRHLLPIFAALTAGCAGATPAAELAAAKDVFERNIKAIQDRDKGAYLACYRADEGLVRAGPEGLKMGFEDLATNTPTTASAAWPSSLIADDVQVRWLRPGVVYGAYRYTVVIDGVETKGLSERVFIESDGQWRISVTTAFPD